MQRLSQWRSIGCAVAVVVGCTWAVGSTWQMSHDWPVRDALARVDLSREEVACGYRMGGADNQERCRDLARIVSRADAATAYFNDGLLALGPAFVLFGIAFWLYRGQRSQIDHHRYPYRRHPHHHGASPA